MSALLYPLSVQETLALLAELEDLKEELALARKCCCQRGARLQILKREVDWERFIQDDYPGAEDWFDEDGVPT